MSSATCFIFALSALLFISTTMGHSQMRCAKYDMVTGNCYAPIRNANVSFLQEANDMTDTGTVCQSPMTNPISDAYANGAGCPDYAPCPAPMGSFAQGETFTIMWLARNHAESDETPGNIQLFLSPTESMTQGDNADFSATVLGQQSICEASFMSCDGQNGNFVQCYATCTMPANAPVGIHTLWWEWVWDEPSTYNVYTTCADVYVTGSGSPVSTPSTSTSTSTTGSMPVTSTTGPKSATSTSTSTTGSKSATSTSTSTSTSAHVHTTSTSSTSTTGKASQSSTSTSTSTSTTGISVPVVTPTPAPTPAPVSTPASTSCTIGYMRCDSESTYQVCDHSAWATPQSCQTGLRCSPSGNYIYCM